MLQSEMPQEKVSRLEHLRQNAAERINSETPEERLKKGTCLFRKSVLTVTKSICTKGDGKSLTFGQGYKVEGQKNMKYRLEWSFGAYTPIQIDSLQCLTTC